MAEEQGGFFGKIGEAVSGAVDFADKQGRKLVGSIHLLAFAGRYLFGSNSIAVGWQSSTYFLVQLFLQGRF